MWTHGEVVWSNRSVDQVTGTQMQTTFLNLVMILTITNCLLTVLVHLHSVLVHTMQMALTFFTFDLNYAFCHKNQWHSSVFTKIVGDRVGIL